MTSSPLLQLDAISQRYARHSVVEQLSLSLQRGEIGCLLGSSGCGKTTVLRCIAGFEPLSGGRILIDGQLLADARLHTPAHKRQIGMVFQDYGLFPHLTVAGNVGFGLDALARDARAAQVARMLALVGLDGLAQRYPHELSGGQQQRVALARALATSPGLLLLDEPLSALDAKLREEMQIELINLQKEVGITFVYVTHDQGEALALSHRIAVMNSGQVEQLDMPETIYSYPRNRFVADFIGQCNVLESEVKAIHGDGTMTIAIKGCGEMKALAREGVTVGQQGWLALRPEKIKLDRELPELANEAYFKGRVHDCLYMGDVTLYIVEVGEGVRIEAMLPNSAPGLAKLFDDNDLVEIAWRFDAGSFLTE